MHALRVLGLFCRPTHLFNSEVHVFPAVKGITIARVLGLFCRPTHLLDSEVHVFPAVKGITIARTALCPPGSGPSSLADQMGVP